VIIKVMDAPGVAGGQALLLCDDEGVALPQQTAAVLRQGVGEVSEITVTFLIDGKQTRFAD